MIITYRLSESELTEDLIQSIKFAFKGKIVEITVSEALDETEYLLGNEANRKSLEKSIKQAAEGKVVTYTVKNYRRNTVQNEKHFIDI